MANLITAQEVIELAFAENSNMREESISDTSIRIAEIKYIKPVFGSMYLMLGTTYSDFTDEYIKPALAYFVKCEIVSSIAIDMSTAGIAVANPQYQSAASDKQRQRLYDSEMSKAKVLLDDALEYISSHAEEFPDFVGTAPKKHYRNGGLILGGGSSPKTAYLSGNAVSRAEFDALSGKVEGFVENISHEFMPATPSGDPMHSTYEAVGAVYNQATGYWSLYDMTDITNEQMRKAVLFGNFSSNEAQPLAMSDTSSPSNIRFNLPRKGTRAAWYESFYNFASGNYKIEFLNLTGGRDVSEWKGLVSQIVNGSNAFAWCEGLRAIFGVIDLQYATNIDSMFLYCNDLEKVYVSGLKKDIAFAQSANLSNESILYMIENSAATSAIRITLHPSALARANADNQIKNALKAKTKVTIGE